MISPMQSTIFILSLFLLVTAHVTPIQPVSELVAAIGELFPHVAHTEPRDVINERNKVAYWWGNGDKPQLPLGEACQRTSPSVVIITFVTSIDPVDGVTITNPFTIEELAAGIRICQSQGTKVLLSLGGATGHITFGSEQQAETSARLVYNQILGTSSNNKLGASLDGIDIDNETGQSAHFSTFISTLRSLMGPTQMLSASPQCPMPDQGIPATAWNSFTMVFVQFYNNVPCNAGTAGFIPAAKAWRDLLPDKVQLWAAVPAEPAAAASGGYLVPGELLATIGQLRSEVNISGIAIWELSEAVANPGFEDAVNAAMQKAGPSTVAIPASPPSARQSSSLTTVFRTSTLAVTSTVYEVTSASPSPRPDALLSHRACDVPAVIICDGLRLFGICDGRQALLQRTSDGTVCCDGVIRATADCAVQA